MPYIELITPIGILRIEATGDSIVKAFFSGLTLIDASKRVKRVGQSLARATKVEKNVLDEADHAISCYFKGDLYALSDVKIVPEGTEFQKRVWKKLLQIPVGKTVSYHKIAQKIHNINAARAVGQACGKNPIVLFVPCHRVTKEDLHLGGYSAGIKRKVFLLQHENALI